MFVLITNTETAEKNRRFKRILRGELVTVAQFLNKVQ